MYKLLVIVCGVSSLVHAADTDRKALHDIAIINPSQETVLVKFWVHLHRHTLTQGSDNQPRHDVFIRGVEHDVAGPYDAHGRFIGTESSSGCCVIL